MGQRVLVIFSDRAELGWLKALKPGFRHCFAVLQDGGRWIAYEPLSHRTIIETVTAAPGADLAAWYRAQGHAVVETEVRAPAPRPLPWAPFTCVEAVKRLVGLRAPGVWTPWQLYRALARTGN